MGLFSEYDPERRNFVKLAATGGLGVATGAATVWAGNELRKQSAYPAIAAVLGELGGGAQFSMASISVEAIDLLSNKIRIATPAASITPTVYGYDVWEPGSHISSLSLTSDWKIDASRSPGVTRKDPTPQDLPGQLAREIEKTSDLEKFTQTSPTGNVLWSVDYSPAHGKIIVGKDGSTGWSIDVSCGRDRGDRSFRYTPFTVFDINTWDQSWQRGVSVMYGEVSGKRWKVTHEGKSSRTSDDRLTKTTAFPSSGGPVIFDDTGPYGDTRLLMIAGLEGSKSTVSLTYNGGFIGGHPMYQMAQMIAITELRDYKTILQTFSKLDYSSYGVNLKPAIEDALKRR